MTNSVKLETGHNAEIATVNEAELATKRNWDALTEAERTERIKQSHADFDFACRTVGHVPFWG